MKRITYTVLRMTGRKNGNGVAGVIRNTLYKILKPEVSHG